MYMLPKIIWMLWVQGWDTAPWIVQQAKKSWEFHNKGWDIILLDKTNIYTYLEEEDTNMQFIKNPEIPLPTKADIIRLALLKRYGGVWTDANVFCLQPLDNWIHLATDTGVFMYHGHSLKVIIEKGCAVWFIAAVKNNRLITLWKQAMKEYFDSILRAGGNCGDFNSHSLETVFIQLRNTNPEFEAIWDAVPFINSEKYGESHCLAAPGNRAKAYENDGHLKYILYENRPFMIKLWNEFEKIFPNKETDECKASNAYFVIELSHTAPKIDTF